MAQVHNADKGQIQQLIVVFFLWKVFLIVLATICPRPGYDTSALVLLDPTTHRHENIHSLWQGKWLVLNFVRWDAIYFVKAALRAKIYEQEWAFSWAYSWLLRFVGQFLSGGTEAQVWHYVAAGIIFANVCHLLSVLVLYKLLTITLGPQDQGRRAFVAAILHILTPASLFMSAPYAESLFSLLNFAGMLQYVQSKATARNHGTSVREDVYKLSSGLLFGLATMMRSNGLLSGLILVYDVAGYAPRAASMRLTIHDLRRLAVTSVAGLFVAVGYIWPQYLAYKEFCGQSTGSNTPLWCNRIVPSVYTWVQSHYWNVGLFRYWTLPNLPLFLMAAPMLWLLFESSVTVLRGCFEPQLRGRTAPHAGTTVEHKDYPSIVHAVPELAIPQLVLAIAATTSFHIQIVNRIASGYPTWYAMVATWIADEQATIASTKARSRWIVRIMITYAIAQGMLFANFLPPA